MTLNEIVEDFIKQGLDLDEQIFFFVGDGPNHYPVALVSIYPSNDRSQIYVDLEEIE